MLRLQFRKLMQDPIDTLEAGTVPNAVPAQAVAHLSGGETITYQGTVAHASTPEGGDNVADGLLARLAGIDPNRFADCAALSAHFPHGSTDGSGLGIACADDASGALTCVCSMLQVRDHAITGCVDIRFPLCADCKTLLAQIRRVLAADSFSLAVLLESDPHHTPKDTLLVQKLLAVYEAQTGKKGACIAIGGGTYVHDIPGGVAFGVEEPGWDYHMHGDNEYLPVDQLCQNTEMMVAAILALCGALKTADEKENYI